MANIIKVDPGVASTSSFVQQDDGQLLLPPYYQTQGFAARARATGQEHVCDVCGKTYATSVYLNRHKKAAHLDIPEEHKQCPKCPMVFKDLKRFWNHIVMVHEKVDGGGESGNKGTAAADGAGAGNPAGEGEGAWDDGSSSFQPTEAPRSATALDPVVEGMRTGRDGLTCKDCGKTFSDRAGVRKHIRNIHLRKGTIFHCSRCGKRFKQKKHMKQHLQEVHDTSEYPCDMCKIVLCSAGGLWRHKKNVHGVKNMVTPNGTAPIRCEFCPEVFYTAYNSHVRECHSEHYEEFMKKRKRKPEKREPTPCNICGHVCYDRRTLRRHIERVHTNPPDRRFACSECGKSFRDKKELVSHHVVHQNSILEPHVKAMLKSVFGTVCNTSMTCSICSTVVNSSLEARLHLYIKHPEKFSELITQEAVVAAGTKCSSCEERFETKEEMISHVEDSHPERAIPTCKYCGHKEIKERELNFHYKEYHPDASRYSCEICNLSFNQKRVLEWHMKREHSADAGECPYCPEKHMRVKMHVTMRHPDKAEEYRKLVADAIKEEREARKKFNQFLDQGLKRKQANKRRKKQLEYDDDDESDEEESEDDDNDDSNSEDLEGQTADADDGETTGVIDRKPNVCVVKPTKEVTLEKYKIEKREPHLIEVRRLPPPSEEPEPEPQVFENEVDVEEAELVHADIECKPSVATLQAYQESLQLCPKTASVKLTRLTEEEIALWLPRPSPPASKPAQKKRKRRRRY